MPRDVMSLTFVSASDLEQAVHVVTAALGVSFELHDSLYRGGGYYLAGGWREPDSETVIVQRNEDLDERAVDVDAPTVVYVERTTRGDEVRAALTARGLTYVRGSDWTVGEKD